MIRKNLKWIIIGLLVIMAATRPAVTAKVGRAAGHKLVQGAIGLADFVGDLAAR